MSNGTVIDKPKKIDGFDEWEVNNAADTLIRAEEIKANKKLFNAASKVISKKLIAVQAAKLKATKKAAG
jgi:hypothetical protein